MGVDHPAAVPAPWTTPVDTTLSAGPTATRRTMYAGDTSGTVYALSPATGQPRWSAPLDPATGPVTANGPVFAADHNGRIQTLNATTGRRRWSPWVDKEVGAGSVVSHGKVIAVGRNGRVYAFNGATGDAARAATVARPGAQRTHRSGKQSLLQQQERTRSRPGPRHRPHSLERAHRSRAPYGG